MPSEPEAGNAIDTALHAMREATRARDDAALIASAETLIQAAGDVRMQQLLSDDPNREEIRARDAMIQWAKRAAREARERLRPPAPRRSLGNRLAAGLRRLFGIR